MIFNDLDKRLTDELDVEHGIYCYASLHADHSNYDKKSGGFCV